MKTAVILGAGVAGCTAAHQLALEGGWRVVVLERAPLAGAGVRTLRYAGHPYTFGPRHFLAQNASVVNYMQEFCPLRSCADHEFKTFVESDAAFYNFPIHMDDIKVMPDAKVIMKEVIETHDDKPRNLQEFWVGAIGPTLYYKLIHWYNKKMWQMEPAKLDTFRWSLKGAMIQSGPRAGWTSAFSGYPLAPEGYNDWINLCLSSAEVHFNAEIQRVDLERRHVYWEAGNFIAADVIISTISPDILCGHGHQLSYIGRDFHRIVLPIEFALPPHVYFTYEAGTEAWTRLTEYKKFTHYVSPHTLLSLEIPSANGRHYPIPTLAAQAQARKYIESLPPNVYSIGRSGCYRYEVDIAVCVETAMALRQQLREGGGSHAVPLERLR